MKILIAVASRHGSTQAIAEAIAAELRTAGYAVDVRSAGDAHAVARYDAVIAGSAVYMGNWLPAARQFLEANRADLVLVPVWLFSSGPLGEDFPLPGGDPAHVAELLQDTGARGHRIFAGKLDPRNLSLSERLVARAIRPPKGEFRDWEAIRAWAREIAATLPALAGPGA